jgi:hypothetical protein
VATHHRDGRVAAGRERVSRLLGARRQLFLQATAPSRETGIDPIKGVLDRECWEP